MAEWYITSWMVSVISKEEPKDTIPPDSDQFINNLAFLFLSKGEDVDKILKRKSESDGYEWKVIARVY